MCQYASFFHNPVTREVKVKVLDSHGQTEKEFMKNMTNAFCFICKKKVYFTKDEK